MSLSVYSDDHFMKLAIQEAQKAFDADEVPVGAVIVCDNQIIAKAHNLTETLNDVTAHAEMQAFTMAANYLGGKFLDQCTLYVTLEPCAMCAGASYWTRLKRIVIGASDKSRGFRSFNENMLHPKTVVEWGLMEETSSLLLKEFFQKKRGM
ncbi:nucleoside deaminase [Flavobacteriales bacterium]|jgi:tRNA(adenine34) deaminase|nr:nucleoside deaminase [Flavobacteriales bacterium]